MQKEGIKNYKELQKENAAPYNKSDISAEDKLLLQYMGKTPKYQYDGWQTIKSPMFNTGTKFGKSSYDPDLINQTDLDIMQNNPNEIRAENQSWYSKVINGIAKGVVLAGTTFLDGTVGRVVGAVNASKTGTFSGNWDNGFSQAMQGINQIAEEEIPNYYTEDEIENPMALRNIFSANFLGDKLLKNIGFTVGAYYSGGIFTKALGLLKLPKLISMLTRSEKAASAFTSLAGSTFSAINEGSIEAINNSGEWAEEHRAKLGEEYNQRIEALRDEYEANKGKEFNEKGEDKALLKFQKAAQYEQAAYSAALGRLDEDRLKMGNADLLMNLPILMASNMIQFGKLFSKGASTAQRTTHLIKKMGNYAPASTNAGALLAITKGALSEGTEEILQSGASNIAGNYYATDVNNYYKSKIDPKAEQETLSWIKSFGEGLNKTVNDESAWEEFFIGSLTGALGIPMFRGVKNSQGKWQSPITIEGGAFNEWREHSQKMKKEQELADRMNARVQSPEFRNYYQGLIRHNKYQDDMNKAAEEGNTFDFKNAEHAQLLSDITMFDKAGRLDDLYALIESASDTSDSNLEAIVEGTTNKVTAQEQKDTLKSKIDAVQAQIQEHQEWLNQFDDSNYRQTIDEMYGETMSQEDRDNLVADREQQVKEKQEALSQLQEQLASLQEESKKEPKDTSIGPFVDENGNSDTATPEGKQNMKDSINKAKEEIFNAIKEYRKIKNNLDILTKGQLSDEQLEELTWMQSQLNNWENRSADMVEEVKPGIQNVIANLENLKEIASSERYSHENDEVEGEGFSKEYNEADKKVQKITKAIANLQKLLSLKNEKVAISLAKNPKFTEGLIENINELDEDVMGRDQKQDIIAKLNDIKKMGEASEIYRTKLTEYLENPQKQANDHAKIIEQATQEYEKEERVKRVNALNNTANFQEVENLMDSEDFTSEDMEASTSNVVKDYKKATLFRDKAAELIANSDSEHKSLLLDMLNRRFNENGSYDDLSDDSLVTDLPLEATTLDEIEQETIENEFNNILKGARDKVNSGKSQKQDVETEDTGAVTPENTGKDEVPQPPTPKPFSAKDSINKISKLDIAQEAKDLYSKIANNIEKLSKDKSVILLRQTLRDLNELSTMMDNNLLTDLKDKLTELSKSGAYNPGSLEELSNETALEEGKNEPTEVTGVLKAVIPQFDLDAKKDGVLLPFVREGTNQSYAYVYNKLSEVDPKTGKNAFDYVNEGNVKEGDELEVRYEEATDEHPELLALYHNGTLINYMNTDESIVGVKEIKDRAKKGEKPTVRVSKIMDGQFSYSRENTQSVGDLLGTDDAVIGVMKNRTMSANTESSIEPVFDEANSDGRVYILLPNSKGTLSAKRVYVKHLNREEFDLSQQDTTNNFFAFNLKNYFSQLSRLGSSENAEFTLDLIYGGLTDLLYLPDSFHLNIVHKGNETYIQVAFNNREGERQNRNILLKREAKKSLLHIGENAEAQNEEEYIAPEEEIYNQILEAFYDANLAFNINAKKLASKNGKDYATQIKNSNVLYTYLTSKRMQGTWFLLNEKPNSHDSTNAYEKAKAKEQAKTGTRVVFNNKEYFVRNGVTYDQTGSVANLGENEQAVKDIAYINSAYGNSYFGVNQHDGKVLLIDNNGKRGFDRKTNKYLTAEEVENLEKVLEGRKEQASQTATAVDSLQESQKLVKRDEDGKPDTSNGSYMIKEEDGQYYEYSRVHSVIGSNYKGKKKENSATSMGTLVDELARQYLIDPDNVTRPEGMSDIAFATLKIGLDKFKKDAKKRGLILNTDRIVVFHKYPDGRRIAGELDIFAYNPDTGEITIFDFKTSKYSTKDKAFSTVTRPDLFTRSTKEQYTLQLSAYSRLFEDSFGVPVTNLVLLPFQLNYTKGELTRIYREDYVPLNKQEDVFSTAKKPAEQPTPKTPGLKTVKGQYVTMASGKPEYHQADMQILFTTKNGQTFYLAKVGDNYKLILPNGRSMTIDSSLISDEVGRTRNNIMDFIQADNVSALIQEAMKESPLDNSPYSNSIEVKEEVKKKVEEEKPSTSDDKMKKGLEAADRLNNLKPTTPTQQDPNQENLTKREQDNKGAIPIDLSTELGRSQLARKKWAEMTTEEKDYLMPVFEGMEEKDIQEYWDGTDAVQRETIIPACK